MRIPGGENNHWHWPEATAAARVIVFAGSAGERLPIEEFYAAYDAMTAAFDMDRQVVGSGVDLYGKLGAKCLLNNIAPLFQQLEPERLDPVMEELGGLAGGDAAAKAAVAVGKRLAEVDAAAAVEALKDLGGMAAGRVARRKRPFYQGWSLAK